VLIKCLKKSGQVNDKKKIIKKHTVTKRVVLELKNGISSAIYVSIYRYIIMCVYIYMSWFLFNFRMNIQFLLCRNHGNDIYIMW